MKHFKDVKAKGYETYNPYLGSEDEKYRRH